MFSVAIVENDRNDLETLVQALRQYEEQYGIQMNIASFENAEIFLTNYKPIYDVVFMDIELEVKNGMEAAHILREYDENVVLIFVTKMSQFALEGYKVNALDYFVKPISYFDIEMRMQRIFRAKANSNFTENRRRLIVGNKSIPLNEIYYIEIMNHALTYHTLTGDYEVYGYNGLSKLEKELTSEDFVRCSSSYLVNLRWCREINADTIRVGKTELRLTRGMRKNFIARFGKLMSTGTKNKCYQIS